MIPKECKRLAEVDFPIAVVSKHAAREKSIRHGHPSTLHLWWARRPLAACRAMLLALLLPDPCDEHCPDDFKKTSRELLAKVQGKVGPKDEDLRKSLIKFIGDSANWDLSADRTYLEISRGLVKAAHPEQTPVVVDPFAGGGSIPLEALRLGCETFASDLNPVACLILKVVLEDIPRYGPQLAEELRRIGAEIQSAAKKELSVVYPVDTDGAKPIAYLWARTVHCEQPNCGAEIPLVRSFWLRRKGSKKRAFRYRVSRGRGQSPRLEIEIFEPKSDRDVPNGTVSRAKATCPCCNIVLSPDRVRAQLAAQHGGADAFLNEKADRVGGAQLLAVITLRPGEEGRHYRLPEPRDYAAIYRAMKQLEKITEASQGKLTQVPDEPLPPTNTNCFRIPNYGMKGWADVSTARQKVGLATIGQMVRASVPSDKVDPASLKEILALAASRCTDFNSSLNSWATGGEFVRGTFARQALSMVWDFCETMPLTTESGGFDGAVDWVARVVEQLSSIRGYRGQVQAADASASPLPTDAASIWFTDPPYYDAVGYAELSDFFFVWLKRLLPEHHLLRDPYDTSNPLVHKSREIVQDENYESVDGKPKDRNFFEQSMAQAFAEGSRVLDDEGIGCVVFAHKTTEGWEALLSGMIRKGWVITASWPVASERPGRLRSQESAALATSVHLVCRTRNDERIGDWEKVLRELPSCVGEWMDRLQSEGIRGADLVFASIGPALGIFSKYSKVVDAEDREIPLGGDPEATEPHKRGYLAYVWEAVGRAALEQVLGTAEAAARNGAAGALEEDARLTALFLWTLQSTNGEDVKSAKQRAEDEADEETDNEEEAISKKKKKGLSLVFDVVRRFAQPLGIHLDNWEDRIIETDKGIVRLLPVAERGEQLFGQDGADLVAERLEQETGSTFQMTLFREKTGAAPTIKGKKDRGKTAKRQSETELRSHQEATTLDRVHAAMLLQASGRTNALRALLQAEQDRGPDFLRLANALSALYPRESEEKRLLDAMLLGVPR